MKDYNFMISDDGPRKTRFCKKMGEGGGGLTKTFLIMMRVGAKGGGARMIFYFEGDLAKKRGVTFFGAGSGSYPGAHCVKVIFVEIFLLKLVRIIWKCCIKILVKFVANDKVT